MTSPDRWLDEEQQRTCQELLTVVIALPALLNRQLQRDAGISNFEYSVMARLSMTQSNSMRLGELATQCNSNAATPFEAHVALRAAGLGDTPP